MLVGFRFSQYIHTRPGAPSGAAATSPSVFAHADLAAVRSLCSGCRAAPGTVRHAVATGRLEVGAQGLHPAVDEIVQFGQFLARPCGLALGEGDGSHSVGARWRLLVEEAPGSLVGSLNRPTERLGPLLALHGCAVHTEVDS